jgi:hypothetical protein
MGDGGQAGSDEVEAVEEGKNLVVAARGGGVTGGGADRGNISGGSGARVGKSDEPAG